MAIAPSGEPGRSWIRRVSPLPPGVVLVLWVYLTITVMVAVAMPFPSRFDELAHLSVIRAEAEHVTIFPDYPARRLLAPDLAHWSANENYINHPSLYYLALAPVSRVGGGVLTLRLVNVFLSFLALLVAVLAGCRVLTADLDRTVFAVLAASFPKAAVIGGMINNDNLAALAGSLLFAGLLRGPGGAWLIAGALALGGWTKLTALIGLGAVAALHLAGRPWSRTSPPSPREVAIVVAGLAIGTMPYLANLLSSGHLLYVSVATYYIPPAARPPFGFGEFAAYFFGTVAEKWPATEAALPLWLASLIALLPLGMVATGLCGGALARRVGAAYLAALALMLAIHLLFGWRSFVSMGDLTIAQTRYYNILWPGIAFVGSAAVTTLLRRHRAAGWLVFGGYLWPTALGGVIGALIGRAA